jgi:hypothetical protein
MICAIRGFFYSFIVTIQGYSWLYPFENLKSNPSFSLVALKCLFLQLETHPLPPFSEKPIKKRPFLSFSIGFSQRGGEFSVIWLFCKYELLIHLKAKHKKRSPLCEKSHR